MIQNTASHTCIDVSLPDRASIIAFVKPILCLGVGYCVLWKKKFLYALNCFYSFVLFFPATTDEERVFKNTQNVISATRGLLKAKLNVL